MRPVLIIPLAEAARQLGRPERTVRRWVATGRLAGQRLGRSWAVYVTDERSEHAG